MSAQPSAELQQSWREAIHAAGMRVTPQREALLVAVHRLRHATAESLLAELARADAAVNLSTVYRGLEALEGIGLVRHAHIGSGGPTYHIAVDRPHIHLRCDSCGAVRSADPALADTFVAALGEATGFAADITHAAIHGRCRHCMVAAAPTAGEDGV